MTRSFRRQMRGQLDRDAPGAQRPSRLTARPRHVSERCGDVHPLINIAIVKPHQLIQP
jgi:hypothetical protein